jgi:hypothetical protein
MQKTYLEDFFERMNDKVFFVLVISIQVLFIFQGLDFADSGFDAEFYTRIFRDPSSVQYNFMFWFTGVIGGAWLKLLPGMGLLGLRFAGVLFTTITFWITYDLLKRYLHTGPLRLSLLLIILFLSTSIKELNYDDVSALFFMCAAALLFSGLTKSKPVYIFLAGSFIALNSFSRIPNISGLLLVSAIWFSGYLNQNNNKQILTGSLTFITGFVIASLGMIILMRSLHHDVIFFNSLRLVRQMGADSQNSHGIYSLLKASVVYYGEALSVSIVVLVALWSSSAAWKRLKTDLPSAIPYLKFVKYLVLAVLTAIIIYRAKRDPDFWLYLFLFYAGTSLIVGFLIITGRQPTNLRLLTAIGCIMLLVLPIGSDYVLLTVGKYSIWIIIPITVDYLLNIQALSSKVILSENSQHIYEQVIDRQQITGLREASLYLTLIFVLAVSYYYPYFDRSGRFQLRFTINNSHVHGIYTTERRAHIINELLAASTRFVKPEDYVLAFESLPMYYFLTDTRPFMHNSWLRLYDDQVFKDELYKSLGETHICPVIIMQKRSTLGNNWPENYAEDFKFKAGQWEVMQDFIKNNQYNKAWQNDFFEIYMPANRNAVVYGPNFKNGFTK